MLAVTVTNADLQSGNQKELLSQTAARQLENFYERNNPEQLK